ncbi:signal transduction histidine kinase [Mycetocola sp. CAN_C7]|uniref:sensor histidine kinase n=1 Tax=Mycetocola sp. CAN_C7 TaxID=2787724 RepID=UPI0018CB2D96
MNHSALTPVFAGLRWSLHLLLIGLLVLVMVRVTLADAPNVAAVHGASVVMLAVYLGGAWLAHRRQRFVSAAWAGRLWVLALSINWLVLVLLAQDAAFVVFPLFFLYLQLLPTRIAVAAVLASTAVTITAVGMHAEFSIGGVLGPMIGAGVAVAIGLGYRALYREAEERQSLIAELVETRDELALAERAAGVLAERERLAREIHDTVAQGLSSIQLLLHAAERLDNERPGIDQLRLARETAADSLVDTRRIIAELTPPALDDRTLPGALRRLAAATEHTLRAAGASTSVHFQLVGDVVPLPMSVDATLLRIAQGAIANVVRHANARRVELTLTYQPDSVTLDVVDDGTGFDPDATAGTLRNTSFGLTAIRQRLSALGGTLSVESAPGEGAALAATIPITDAAATARPLTAADV